MKRRLLFLIPAFLALGSFIYSQPVKNKDQLSFSIGSSFPVGQYANKNINSNKAGIASVGGAVNFSYTHMSKKKISIVASLIGQINPLRRYSMEESFSERKFVWPILVVWSGSGPPPFPPQSSVTYSNWKFKNSTWKLGTLLLGGYKEFKTRSPNIAFTSKLQAGLVFVSSPEVDGSSITDTTNIHVTQTNASAFGFSYLVSGGLKIKLNAKINFLTSVEYFGTNNITFKNIVASLLAIKSTSNPANNTAFQNTTTANAKQRITSVNLFAGFGLRL